MTTPVRIGILGTAFVCDYYMQALRYVAGQEVTGVFSRTREHAESFAQAWQIPFHTNDLEEFAARADIDLYAIGLPNHVHAEAAILLACEQFFSADPQDASEAMRRIKPLARTDPFVRKLLDTAAPLVPVAR